MPSTYRPSDVGTHIRGANGQPFRIVKVYDGGMVLAVPTKEDGTPIGSAVPIYADDCRRVTFDLAHWQRTGDKRLGLST